MKSYTCQPQRIRSFEAMKIISTVMISYYLFLYRAVYGVHHTFVFAVFLLHFFPFQVNAHQFRFIKNEWVNRFDWIDNSIDSMNLFNEIHFIVDHFQFYKQYSCNSCEAMLFNNQFKSGQNKKKYEYICPQTVEQGEIILPSRSIHSSVIIGNLKE